MFSGVAVALPTLGADLGAGATSLGLMETLFLAGSLALLLPLGRIADAGDKNTFYKLGMLSFGVCSILIGSLSFVPAILAVRFLQGVTAAILTVTGPAILAEIVPAERRGQAFGASLGAIYAGLTLGPICAGILIGLGGWRAVFLAGAAAILMAFLLVHWLLPSAWRRPEPSVHHPSAALVVAAVLCLVAGSALLRHGLAGGACLAAGIALATGFVLLQLRLKRPLLDVRTLVRHGVLRNALSIQLLLYLNAYCSIFLMSLYMQVSLARSAQTSGRVLAVGSALMAVMAPVSGRLADRFPPHRIAALGAAFVFASSVLATTFRSGSSLGAVALMLALQGLGFALFSSPNMAIIMNSVPPQQSSMASALGAKARSLGMLFGMLITALLISLALGNDPVEQHPERFVGIVRTAFTFLAVLSGAALVLSVLTRPRGPPRDQ